MSEINILKPKEIVLNLFLPLGVKDVDIQEVKRGDKKPLLFTLFPFFIEHDEIKKGIIVNSEKIEEVSGYRELQIKIIESSPAKVLEYTRLSLEGVKNPDLAINEKEGISEEIKKFNEVMGQLLIVSLMEVCENVSFQDDIIRLILGNNTLIDGIDFVPFLTLVQRVAIVKAFLDVNPVFREAEKKMAEKMVQINKLISPSNTEMDNQLVMS